MVTERTNIEFPLWRKKVDSSLFQHKGSTIPKWACRMWAFEEQYPQLLGKKDPTSRISIIFNGETYAGSITATWPKNRADRVYRFWFKDDLKVTLQETFLMSYMRDIEGRLGDRSKQEIEASIPFWEFLDIEFDSLNKIMTLSAHYKQSPTFPELFKRLISSPALKRIDDELLEKSEFRIHKQDWKPRSEYEVEIGAENVIYMLLDNGNKLLYVGEATNLVKRFKNGHPSIPEWTHYRYDALPSSAAEYRVALERMIIRNFASTLPNKRGVNTMDLSGFKLANDKIDL
ncbi:GIY-YIG nuclease family protein [Thalassospira lucentensis]|uniref:GIY-YIG nuclease family protein n=1 Tax=Thalassospira lucentensis TaxID=168935 RepID=UPI00142DBDFC|nr:GIY-YIG nuclease family protein [Thalassospira lucentensis]NIZ01931.1 GIY-YIG nuclease family protein [Thalassospira lucentensis]